MRKGREHPVSATTETPPPATSAPPTIAQSATPGTTVSSSVGSVIEWLAVIVPLTSVAAGLAFWFGWTWTAQRGAYFGLDNSVVEFTPTDYILRSADALIVPAILTTIVALVWLALHALVLHFVDARRGLRGIRIACWIAVLLGFAGLVVSVPALWRLGQDLSGPILLGLSAAAIAEASSILRRSARGGRPPRLPAWHRGGYVVATMLVVLSLFWAFSQFAKGYGHGRAVDLAHNVNQLAWVVVYSDLSLGLDAPVVETRITEPDSAYHFRYSGLRLLTKSGDKYFLVPDGWTSDNGHTIVLEEQPGLRLEYSPASAQDQEPPRFVPP